MMREKERLYHRTVIGVVQRDDVKALVDLLDEYEFGFDDLARGLQVAAQAGYEECVRILLENGANTDFHDPLGETPLIKAAKNRHSDVVKLLIKRGAKVDKPMFRIRATALHWAASYGDVDCAQLLLDAGANVELQTSSGRTPIMLAARSDQAEIVQMLIDSGANVNTKDNQRATAVHLAAEEGCDDCVRLLLRNNADVNAKMKSGDTPIMRAVKEGRSGVVRLLVRREADLKQRGFGLTAVHWAAESGHHECLRHLLEAEMPADDPIPESYYGANYMVNAGVTPLMLAARGGYSETVRMLLKTRPKIDREDAEGRTALLYAINYDHPHCVEALLEAGADPDGVTDSMPFVPVKPGYRSSSSREASSHMRNDWDSDESDDDGVMHGESPLFMAIRKNHVDCLKVLLRENCKLDVIEFLRNGQPVGAVEYALECQHIRATQMVLTTAVYYTVINPNVLQQGFLWLLDTDESLGGPLVDLLHIPRRLMHLCRAVIRQRLGHNAAHKCSQLPLPPAVIKFVNLGDLDDI